MNLPTTKEAKQKFVHTIKTSIFFALMFELLIVLLAFFLSSRGGWLSLLGTLFFLVSGCLLIYIGFLLLTLFLARKATEIKTNESGKEFSVTFRKDVFPNER